MKNIPKITIVTPSFNQADFLEATIQSVLSQSYPNLEYIIVDGGSTDGSVEIIKRYEEYITWWVSEPDRGQSHAINKGLERATGEIFNWVNSDDLLAPGALMDVAYFFLSNPNINLLCGYFTSFSEKGYTVKRRMKIYRNLEKTLVYGHVSPCSMFWKLDALKTLGSFDERLNYCMDLELWYRYLFKFGIKKFAFVENNLAFFRQHEESKTIKFRSKFYTERYNIQKSILNSLNISSKIEDKLTYLNQPIFFKKDWRNTKIDVDVFASFMIQDQIEFNYAKLDLYIFFRLFIFSFKLNPTNRGWRFYLLPLRRVSWILKDEIKKNS